MKQRLLYEELLHIGNTNSNIGVITLWSKKEEIVKRLDMSKVFVIGQLYSKNKGINVLIRNCLQNKLIRYLVLVGSDFSNSGRALLNLSRFGINDERRIINNEEVKIDEEIPLESLNSFRKNVKIIDCSEMKDYEKIKHTIASLPILKRYGEYETITEKEPDISLSFPCESSSFLVRQNTVAEAWLDIMHKIITFGKNKKSQYVDDQKELVNMMTVIETEDPENICWKDFFQFSKKDLYEYYPKVLSSKVFGGVEYTYGQRLFDYEDYDQINYIVKTLEECEFSRRAVAFTWNVSTDNKKSNCPCLNMIQALVNEGKLFFTAYFRSNDMFGAFPRNAFALRKLQALLSRRLNIPLGSLTIISSSAHIYQSNLQNAKAIIAEHRKKKISFDPRGNFFISTKDGMIKVDHLDGSGNVLTSYEGDDSKKILFEIYEREGVSDIYHAMYLGKELQKAELSVRMNLKYIQDEGLPVP